MRGGGAIRHGGACTVVCEVEKLGEAAVGLEIEQPLRLQCMLRLVVSRSHGLGDGLPLLALVDIAREGVESGVFAAVGALLGERPQEGERKAEAEEGKHA